MRLRLLTWNIHKGIGGVDRRYRPTRTIDVIRHYELGIEVTQLVNLVANALVIEPKVAIPVEEVVEEMVAEAMPLAGRTILVADDEPDQLEYLATVFEDNGATVLRAADGDEALVAIQEAAQAGLNVYVGVAMRREPGNGTKRNLAYASAVWADVDLDPGEAFTTSPRRPGSWPAGAASTSTGCSMFQCVWPRRRISAG